MPKAKAKAKRKRPYRVATVRTDVRMKPQSNPEQQIRQFQLLRDSMIRECNSLRTMATNLRGFRAMIRDHKARHIPQSAEVYCKRAVDSLDILIGYLEDSQRHIGSDIEAIQRRSG